MPDERLVRFTPGDGSAFVAADRVAVTAGALDSPTARALRSLVGDRLSLAAAMTDLSRLGFDHLDSFALVVVEHEDEDTVSARLLHRGDIVVTVERADGPDIVFHRPQVATWREESVDAPRSIRVELGGFARAPLAHWCDGAAELPAAALGWTPRLDAAAPRAAVAPAATPRVVAAGVPALTAEEPDPDRVPALAEPAGVDAETADGPALEDTPPDVAGPDGIVGTASEPLAPPVPEPLAPPAPAPPARAGSEPQAPPALPTPGAAPPVTPAGGEADDIDFANLVHHTVFRKPEDAAVRASETSASTAPPVARPAQADDPPPSPAAPTAAGPPLAADATRVWRDRTGSGLIDAVPPTGGASPSLATRGVGAPDAVVGDSDHDGFTVARRPGRVPPTDASRPPRARPAVHAVHCPDGHPNPPTASACRICAMAISERAARTEPRPQLGVLRSSTGQTAVIDGPMVIGRNPPSGVEIDGEQATAVAIDDSEISRYHLAVRVAEWSVSVEDQGSTNGTVVHLPGQPDRTLRPFERVQVVVGAVVELGANVTVRFDAT